MCTPTSSSTGRPPRRARAANTNGTAAEQEALARACALTKAPTLRGIASALPAGAADRLYLGVADQVLALGTDLVEGRRCHGDAERVAVVDAHRHRSLGIRIRDLDHRADRERTRTGGQ